MTSQKKIFNASLLIAGTTIGAGMLALPVVTATCGFIPSILLFFLCYLFMLATGLLLAEALLWFPGEYNLISLSSKLLGPFGKWISWLLYLFLFYTLSVAFIAGASDILQIAFGLPKSLNEILFVAVLAFFVMRGTKSVNFVNHYLMIGMFIAYAALLLAGWQKLEFANLKFANFSKVLYGLPVIFTSFSYQGIVPSMKTYLEGDSKALKKAIFYGITIPFLFYFVWQAFIMGIIPQMFLEEAQTLGKSAIFPLEKQLDAPWIFHFGKIFAFFAITTSFLGVSLGLKDFLKDGLPILKSSTALWLCLATFLPPMMISLFTDNIYITALRYAGGIGCALLLGLMPILMVWKGRYALKHKTIMGLFLKSKTTLFALTLFVIIEVLLEIKFLIMK